VLQEMETARALGIADMKAARRDVQIATGSKKGPGARLHVLTIGVSDYGDKAKDLRLKFAHRDAQDLASALVNTQEGGLYAEVKLMSLHDGTADKPGIFEALAIMDRNMGGGAGQDLAVVMFSGHGTMIDGQFYLVPYGADNSTPARLKVSAIAQWSSRVKSQNWPAWPGPGFARRLPICWPDWRAASRRRPEVSANCRQHDRADFLVGGQTFARG